MIDPTKTYKTRDGRDIKIFMTDNRLHHSPVLGAYKDHSNVWWPHHWGLDGRAYSAGPTDLDLIEVKPRIVKEWWAVIGKGRIQMWDGKSNAQWAISNNQVPYDVLALVPVTIDCEEGAGL